MELEQPEQFEQPGPSQIVRCLGDEAKGRRARQKLKEKLTKAQRLKLNSQKVL